MILSKKISKFSDDTFEDLFEVLFKKLINWIEQKSDVYPITDYKTCKKHFFIFLIDNVTHGKNINNDYIVFNYFEDIVDLFLCMKNISSSYTSNILHENYRTANDLLYFIFDNNMYIETNKEIETNILHIDEIANDYEYNS
tara:strand:- start:244 stop:666 length:423 start_codon:yes stop_codon:yes gene_type:complete